MQVKLDYLAAGVYRDDALSFIPTAEGRYIPPSAQAPGRIRFVGSYEYQQTDQRSVAPSGNLRTACQCGIKLDVATSTLVPVLLTENPITLSQENHYDPWGLNLADIETSPIAGLGGLDWWQYNAGSEKSYLPDGSFDYDTDFRGYDPQIGRFKGVDALADALPGISTFQFGYNNPLSFQDPTGLISYTGGSSGGGGGWGGILGFGLNIAFNAIGSSLMQHTPTPRPVVQGNKMITPSDATHYNRPLVNGTPEPFNIQSVNVERAMKKRLPGEPIHYASGAVEPVYPETFAVPALATYRGLSEGVVTQDLLQTSLSLSRFGSFGQGVEISTVLRAKHVSHIAAKGGAGVYDLGTTLGKYVGQSKDIMGRVTSHFAKGGKLSAGELNNAVFHSMPGSTKLQREVYEQFLINKYGINNLLNVRNPMGGRMDLYNSMVDDVIKQFGLPR